MPDFTLIIFCVAFLSQIILLSYYYPNKVFKRMCFVIENYPPSKYPKLYPGLGGDYADEVAKKSPNTYRYINMAILSAGLFILFKAMMSGYYPSGDGEEILVFLFAAVQFAPLIYLEYAEFKQFKLMRKANKDSRRKADLEPRNFFGFVSPIIFGGGVILMIAALIFTLHIHDYDMSSGSSAFTTVVAIIGVHIYFAVIIMWQVYGKKLNPHQSHKDRRNHMGATVRTMVYTSIALSILVITIEAVREYNLDHLEPLIMSVYFQLLAVVGLGTMLRSTKIENIDFEAYKEDSSAA